MTTTATQRNPFAKQQPSNQATERDERQRQTETDRDRQKQEGMNESELTVGGWAVRLRNQTWCPKRGTMAITSRAVNPIRGMCKCFELPPADRGDVGRWETPEM